MKRKILIFILAIAAAALALVACGTEEDSGVTVVPSVGTKGNIGAFSLLAPAEGELTFALPEFSWEKASGADSYELEVCSSTAFSQTEDTVYVKKTGIVGTKFALTSTLKEKNVDYYWRVTAVNLSEKKTSAVSSFRLVADEKEILFDIDYADEWEVHQLGSKADVSVNKNDFFGSGENSLVVSFVEEDVNRGIPETDGWIVVTHSEEIEMYGVDAFFFNFYYSGDDSDIYLRVVDEDNEYWHAQIKVAQNAKQTIIIRFDEFELRTKGGTTIANRVFDYNYIKYIELVFERSFGDGVAMISDLRAVSFANYGHLFVDKFDFNTVNEGDYTYENYVFDTEISEDGSSFTYSFYNAPNDKNDTKFNGYGFVKLPVEKLLVSGNAFKFNLSTTLTGSQEILIRLIEEDGDRWYYTQKVKTIPADGNLVVPYMAFTLSYYNADAIRQFGYVKQFQFGLRDNYSTGSVTVSGFEVCTLAEEIDDLYVNKMGDNGVIDDFNGYANDVDVYYKWMLSDTNKDEVLAIDKDMAVGGANKCLKLGYKADMGQAQYGLMFAGKEGFSALSFSAIDRSVKQENAAYNHIKEVAAKMIVSLYVNTGEEYITVVDELSKYWTRYTFALKDFKLVEGYYGDITPLSSENIAGVKIAFQYYYYAMVNDVLYPYPAYTSNNFVYIDDLKLSVADSSSAEEVIYKIMPSTTEAKVAIIDNFDSDTDETVAWSGEKGYEYEFVTISDESAYGTGKSLNMNYKGSTSVAYVRGMVVDPSVNFANGMRLIMKGDGVATVYLNVFFVYAGKQFKYRATITNVSDEWTAYFVPFGLFAKQEGEGDIVINKTQVPNVNKISIGIVNSTGAESAVLLDEIAFVEVTDKKNIVRKTLEVTP